MWAAPPEEEKHSDTAGHLGRAIKVFYSILWTMSTQGKELRSTLIE